MNLSPSQVVVVAALDIELPANIAKRRAGMPILITGMGKLNASCSLVEYVWECQDEIKLVINLGSCGSKTLGNGLVLVEKFSSWDQEFPEDLGEGNKTYEVGDGLEQYSLPWPRVHCATGDKFVTNQEIAADVFDMEAYALAYVCDLYNIPLLSVKYVSDSGSVGDWYRAIEHVRAGLGGAFDRIMDVVLKKPRGVLSRSEERRRYVQQMELTKKIKGAS